MAVAVVMKALRDWDSAESVVVEVVVGAVLGANADAALRARKAEMMESFIVLFDWTVDEVRSEQVRK